MVRRRLTAGLALVAVGVLTAALLLTDRAPRLYRRFVRAARDEAAQIRDWLGVEVERSDIPFGAAALGHVVLFAFVTLVAGIVVRRRVPSWRVALAVFAVSAVFELVQPLVSTTRHQELDDLVANGIGVVMGWAALWLLLRIRRLRRSRSLAL